MKRFLALVLLFLFFFSPFPISAQILINEFHPRSSEWVEFFNSGSGVENLAGYFFDDDSDFNIDGGVTHGSNKFALQGLLSPGKTCYWDLTTYLNDSGDSPTLFDSAGSIKDTYTYASSSANISYARVPDGEGWQVDQIPSKSSISCLSLAPTPTPAPTPTSTPTPTPSPTPTPIPTSKPTLKPTAKPTFKPTSTPAVLGEIDDLRAELATPTPTPTPAPEKGERNFPILAGVFIIGGVGLMGGAFYLYVKQTR